MADYPSLLISFPFDEAAPDYQTIRTSMEMGYVQTRSKTTVAPRVYTFSHLTLPAADVVTWLAFWNARKGGGESFNFTDPRTASVIVCRFDTDRMPDVSKLIRRTGPQSYDIGPIVLEEAL